jgi:transcriptional regulator
MAKAEKNPILQGSLDLLVLQSLNNGPLHGYDIARHLKQTSKDYLQVEEGSLYPALHRMERRGWIKSTWGVSENNRRAKFYQLTSRGTKQLDVEIKSWREMSVAVDRVLKFQG